MVTILCQNVSYENVKLSVIINLLLGHDFFGLHEKLEITSGGERGILLLCGFNATELRSPSLFAHFSPDYELIVLKSHRHSDENERFTRSEIQRLLRDGTIRPSSLLGGDRCW